MQRVHVLLGVVIGLASASAAATSPCDLASALSAASSAEEPAGAAHAFDRLVPVAGQLTADDPCLAPVEAALLTHTKDAHRFAQKFRKRSDYEAADAGYVALRRLPRTAGRTRTDFFHAELLFDLGRFAEADVVYKAVVDADPRGEYARASAHSRVLATEKLLKGVGPLLFVDGRQSRDQRAPDTPVPAPLRVALEKKAIAACDDYIALVGPQVSDGADRHAVDELRRVQFKAAALRVGPEPTGAGPRLRELSVQWPNSDEGKRASLLLLELLWKANRRPEFTSELERISSSVEAGDRLFDDELKAWWGKLRETP